ALWPGKGDFDEARQWARTISERVAKEMPDRATVEFRKASRGGAVYIDTLQNARGHHAVPPYVVRPVAGATVSMPLTWDELTIRLKPTKFTLKTARRLLARQKVDPMADLLRSFARSRKAARV